MRARILEVIRDTRGRVGVPTLKTCFPDATRSELRRLLVCHRSLHAYRPDHLTWSTPGRVWAADYTEPAQLVDGRYRYVLLVRDLASGCQLMSLPVEHATAQTTVEALRLLFEVYGAPLVLKTDNGSHFTAREVTDLLSAEGVSHLRSPPRVPRYNGSIEAGIGSVETRAYHQAAMHGRSTAPTCDDWEAGRRESNAEARPWGPCGPPPEQRWNERTSITDNEREAFLAAASAWMPIEQRRLEIQRARSRRDGAVTVLSMNDRATIARRAIRRALVERGELVIHSRRTATSSTELQSNLSEN
jgi:hypothetical protein